MADLSDIHFILPTTPLQGGAKGASRVLSQSVSGLTTLTGVTAVDAAFNTVSDGVMTYTSSTGVMTWTPPGGSAGVGVNVSADGTYAIQGANNTGYVIITVVAASLPGSNTSNTLTIAAVANPICDDVTKDESNDGVTRYRCVYFDNTVAEAKKGGKFWINTNAPGEDVITIGLDPAGAGGIAAITADENTAPAGVVFSAPTNQADALDLGDLAASQDYPIWIKQVVPAGVTTAVPIDLSIFAFSIKV